MSEILLQAIVEKLESLETALLKQDNADKDEELKATVKSNQSSFIKFNAACDANNKKIDSLSEEIRALQETNSQVRHTHHFHKQVWISVSLFIISLLLAYGWINCSNEKKSFEANDMKYRYWKANGNSSLLRIIYYTDSLYKLNEDHFTNEVLQAERKIEEQEKVQRLEGEKKKMLEK
ncbi:MAG: hypothetical protein ACTHK8_23220 [Ginsengibacter sp.]